MTAQELTSGAGWLVILAIAIFAVMAWARPATTHRCANPKCRRPCSKDFELCEFCHWDFPKGFDNDR